MKAICKGLIVSALITCSAAHAADLTVNLSNIDNTRGTLHIGVADSQQAWEGKSDFAAAASRKPSGSEEAVSFTDLAPGIYAIKVMHDENGNGRLDVGPSGVPVEGYGFSNNPQVMREATFEEAAFEVGENGAEISIRMR